MTMCLYNDVGSGKTCVEGFSGLVVRYLRSIYDRFYNDFIDIVFFLSQSIYRFGNVTFLFV